MKKKPTKKAKPTPKYDSQRETRVLLEKISSDVKGIAEGHGSLKQEITEFRSSMEQRFDIAEMAVTESSRNIKTLQTDVKGLKTDVEGLKTDVKGLKIDVKTLKEGQDRLEKGQEEIKQKLDTVTTDHETRLQKLETAP